MLSPLTRRAAAEFLGTAGLVCAVVGSGIAAERAEVWLHVGEELRVAATWPENAVRATPVGIGSGPPPELPGADATCPVNHRGEVLGANACSP